MFLFGICMKINLCYCEMYGVYSQGVDLCDYVEGYFQFEDGYLCWFCFECVFV